MRQGLIGALTTPNVGNVLEPGIPWALDNGCFTTNWNETKWVNTLGKYEGVSDCLFAVVPDVVCDSDATDERWARYSPVVKAHGYAAAYVTQNGCTAIPSDADVVFTGGDNEWKMSDEAQQFVAEAKDRGLWTHMGRVNSLRRLRFAAAHGYDSVDGTFLAFGPDTNLPRLLRMLRNVEQQPVLS
jgi:hypothetical protein